MTDLTARLRRHTTLLLGVAVVAFFFLIQAYVVRSNWVLLGIYSGLIGEWSFSTANTPLRDSVEVAVAFLFVLLFGYLLLKTLRPLAGGFERFALALGFGFGLSGIAFKLLTMAGLLYPIPSWVLMLVLIGGAGLLIRRKALLQWLERDWRDGSEIPEAAPVEIPPPSRFGRWLQRALLAVIVLISALTLYHGIFFPETYWDSLILYLGYGRMTFLQHAFPFKAEVQVGIGLGANYPHLFSNYGALASTLFGHWSDLHQRFLAPVAGIAATILLYGAIHRLWGDRLTALLAVLLFRSLPYGIAYTTFASDYAIAILFTAMTCHLLVQLEEAPSRGRLLLSFLVPAMAMHLNYLMGILWVPTLLHLALHGGLRCVRGRTPLVVGVFFAIAVALASPWYIRNWVLTGNPVYAFFPQFFPSSVRMNTEVLRSAEVEWFRNGDGIGKPAELYAAMARGEEFNEADPNFQRTARLADRIRASWYFWYGFDIIDRNEARSIGWFARLGHLLRITTDESPGTRILSDTRAVLHYRHAYKMTPLFPGLVFPAFLLAPILLWLFWGWWKVLRLLAVAATLTAALLAYGYLLADFYLYQGIACIVPATVLASALIHVLRTLPRPFTVLFSLQVLVVAGTVGVPFALMNFKFPGNTTVLGKTFSALALDHTRNPGMAPSLFLRLRFPDDVTMWEYLNNNYPTSRLLSHENRHYVLAPGIEIVHLDDWDMQQFYDLNDPKRLAEELRRRGLVRYLRIPNESAHAITRRLGLQALVDAGLFVEEFRSGEVVLYRLSDEAEAPLAPQGILELESDQSDEVK
jgi:4-amino-4-deoxy-L-arabinose transferase-like glycosyltransferase